MGAIPGASFKPHRATQSHEGIVSVLIERGPVSLNLVEPGVADQIE
jgi:hypothetical protein